MIDLFKLILGVLASLFRSRAQLEAAILVLRQQINVLRRRASKRPHLNNTDRFLFVWLYRWFPSVLSAIAIVRPETIIRWHRAGFRAYWRRRSRNRVGRPEVSIELRTLIGEMSCANRLWGAPRIHCELLQLGFAIGRSPRGDPGKTLTLRASLARSAGSAWTTSSCSVKRTCAGSSAPMLPTIMSRGPIDLWIRTPRSIVPFSASAPSHHDPSSADFITNIAESDFRYRQRSYR